MATFSKEVVLAASPSIIPEIAHQIEAEFLSDGFEVRVDQLTSGGADISLSKGGMFKAVLGMKTALKVSLVPRSGSIQFSANVGIFGQQFLPTVISMFFAWPVLLTQIWGLIQQADLDDNALSIANRVIAQHSPGYCPSSSPTESPAKFCPNCETQLAKKANFCSECGKKIYRT